MLLIEAFYCRFFALSRIFDRSLSLLSAISTYKGYCVEIFDVYRYMNTHVSMTSTC